ncbi:MAG: electron transfer flavoprotein subunit alpha/FixB family protein [Crenarchaeota archaeon]|nr:electron transfer flavoprotein subunit alpha/FixB family protein [Thermoproteota archaeon]
MVIRLNTGEAQREAMTVLVYVDYVPATRQPRQESLAIIDIARDIASKLGKEIEGVVINSVVVATKLRDMKMLPKVYNIRLKNIPEGTYIPTLFGEALVEFCKKKNIDVLLFPATQRCREIAPYVAARLDTGLVADVSDLYVDEKGEIIAVKPSFGENILAHIYIPDRKPKMFTVRASLKKKISSTYEACELVHEEVSIQDHSSIEYVKSAQVYDPDIEMLPERHDIVIGVGAGLSRDSIELVKAIAKKMGIGVGATKKITDRGILSSKFLIGESGKIIRPRVYIALGISGAPQHMTGIKDYELLIAVNIDERAPIVNYSTHFYKSDANELVRKIAELVLR